MYKSLKAKWNAQPSLAANQHFPRFRYYLERGGKVALDYIAQNADFVETVIGEPIEVTALKEAISKRNMAHENQVYFVGEAKRLENPIKAILRTRYNALKGHCEQEGIPWIKLTPETLLPATRRAFETGNWESAEVTQDPTAEGVDSPTADAGGVDSPTADAGGVDSPTADAGGVDSPTADDGGVDSPTADDGGVDSPTADDGGVDSPTADDGGVDSPTADGNTLCRHIEELHAEGFNKTDIWAAVKGEATAKGWTRAAVWTYIDELINVM